MLWQTILIPEKIKNMSCSFLEKIKFTLPWTYPSVLRGLIPRNTITILDVGCGNGRIMSWINFDKKYKVSGLDIKKSDLKQAQETGVYTDLLHLNLVKDKLPKRKFDVTVCSQVVEHLDKRDSIKLIKSVEKMTKNRVIIATINGYFPYDHIQSKNKYDQHRSGWDPGDFIKRGYRVYGHGLKFIYQPGGLKDIIPILRPIIFLVSYFLNPFVKNSYRWSLFIIACKDFKKN